MLGLLAIAGLGLSASSEATTLLRMSVEELAADNTNVTIGKVIETYSYWNADGSFILTDAVVELDAVLKGPVAKNNRMELTLMGGQVDDLTAVIIGGAHLEIGKSYVLFTSVSDLPGAPAVATVQHHSQGVFELAATADGGISAISQAADQELVADEVGRKSVPGGVEGMTLDQLLQSIERGIRTPQKEQGVSP